jgi:Fe-S-cluster containining protein
MLRGPDRPIDREPDAQETILSSQEPMAEDPRVFLAEARPSDRQHLFSRLHGFYRDLEEALEDGPQPKGSCAGCNRCCVGPPLFMTCSDLEYDYALQTLADGGRPPGVGFEVLSPENPDKRKVFRKWACPFFSERAGGCTVYTHRPYACRIFGPFAQTPIWWDFCAYQESSRIYRKPEEIPLWDSFADLIRSYRARWGYIFPQPLRYREGSEDLVEAPTASSRAWLDALRLHVPGVPMF